MPGHTPDWIELSKKEGKESYRLPVVFSTASAASSFRSRWGSVRGAPVCNSQASPTAAPQVPQGTDSICFGVSSFVFTIVRCNATSKEDVHYCTLLNTSFSNISNQQQSQRYLFPHQILLAIVSKSEHRWKLRFCDNPMECSREGGGRVSWRHRSR